MQLSSDYSSLRQNAKYAGLASALAIVAATSSQAGNWSGFYVGGEGVTGSSAISFCVSCVNIPPLTYYAPATVQHSTVSFAGGGIYAGYNHTLANGVVVGAEGSYDLLNGSSVVTVVNDATAVTKFAFDLGVTSLASIRGRAGYSTGRTLFYATGGIAYGTISLTNPDAASSATLNSNYGTTDLLNAPQIGFVAGLGVEHMLTDRISLRVQYLAYNFSNPTVTELTGGYAGNRASMTSQTISVGAAYHF